MDELRWITAESWTYSRTFDIKESQLQRAAAFLVTEGLDTIAAVYVNSHLVLENDNMFHTQTTDVRTALVAGANNITIVFSSAPAYAEHMFHACNEATSGFCPDVCPPDVQDGICYVDYIRKEPCVSTIEIFSTPSEVLTYSFCCSMPIFAPVIDSCSRFRGIVRAMHQLLTIPANLYHLIHMLCPANSADTQLRHHLLLSGGPAFAVRYTIVVRAMQQLC